TPHGKQGSSLGGRDRSGLRQPSEPGAYSRPLTGNKGPHSAGATAVDSGSPANQARTRNASPETRVLTRRARPQWTQAAQRTRRVLATPHRKQGSSLGGRDRSGLRQPSEPGAYSQRLTGNKGPHSAGATAVDSGSPANQARTRNASPE